MQQLDEGDAERRGGDAATADAADHDQAAEEQRAAHANLAHENRHEAHHDELEEDLHRVQDTIGLLAFLRRREEAREELREHLLVEDRVEGPAEDDENDDLPEVEDAEDANDLLERWRLRILIALLAVLILLDICLRVLRLQEDQDGQQHCRHSRARPKDQVRIDGEQEASRQGRDCIAERAPGARLSILEAVAAAEPLRHGLEDWAGGEIGHREVDRADHRADVEVAFEHRHIDPSEERCQ